MAGHNTSLSHTDCIKALTGMLPDLDPHDPYDSAFELVVVYDVPGRKALLITGAAAVRSRQALHKRVARWKLSLESPAREMMKAIDIIRGRRVADDNIIQEGEGEENNNTPRAGASSCSTQVAIATALDNVPTWLDRDKTEASMSTRKKRSPAEVCRDNFEDNAKKDYYNNRYTTAFKEATAVVHANMNDVNKNGKRGFGVDAVANDINERLLTSPNDRKLKPTSVYNAVKDGRIGVTPMKRGRKSVVPEILPASLATQAVMMQVAGVGEASAKTMKVLVEGLVAGTEWEDKIDAEYTWRKTRSSHPEILNPVKAKKNEDRRVEWLSYANIMTWTERAKEFLISIGMAKNEPGVIHGEESSISLIHKDDINWFLTVDETHHAYSSEGSKGGPQALRFASNSFQRSGEPCVKSAAHTTGVYGTTCGGEPLPPLYIFSTSAKDEEKYTYDPLIGKTLPTVTTKYADTLHKTRPSYVVVRETGSMDTRLWHDLNRLVYIPCFKGKISPEPIRDPVTQKLISGPLIVKMDSGPGRLSKEAESITFRDEMAKMGVHIVLSLPNGTACTAEMDQLFTSFKQRCDSSTLRVAGKKMAARLAARKKETENKQNNNNDDCGDDNDDDDEAEAGESTSKKQLSACNVNLGNLDLGNMVNGYEGDKIKMRPFDYCFQKQTIINTWKKVGFIPMTANAVNDPKVRHELGEGGAPAAEQERLEALVTDYAAKSDGLTAIGFNGDLLDLEPRVVDDGDDVPSDEEEQALGIVLNKGMTKAGRLYKAGIVVANSRVILRAHEIAQEQEADAKQKKEYQKKESADCTLWIGLKCFIAWVKDGRCVDGNGHPILTKRDAIAIVKVLLPKISPTEKMKDYSSLKKCTKWLGELASGTTWADEMQAMKDTYNNPHMPLERLF